MRVQTEGVGFQVGEGAGVLVGKELPGHARSPQGFMGGLPVPGDWYICTSNLKRSFGVLLVEVCDREQGLFEI